MKKMKRYQTVILLLIGLAAFSCKKQLDVKSSSALEVPVTIADFQSLMDNNNVMTQIWPFAGIAAADEGFVSTANWQSSTLTPRNAYIWDRNVFNENPRNDWSLAYTVIFYTNVVLEGVQQYGQHTAEWNNIQGQASFFRGYAYYQLAQQFCKPYNAQSADTDPGLVLRNSSDLNVKPVRSTVAQTYARMIADLSAAVPLLPTTAVVKTRPCKSAAYAVLARIYLSMRDYPNAGLYADSSLKLNSQLLDYNTVKVGTSPSFTRFNAEVLLHTLSSPVGLELSPKFAVDTTLYRLYEAGDLRKVLFFQVQAGTTYYTFKGSYDGTVNLFNGPATDEMYLIRAESSARSGKLDAAMADLNTLRQNRFTKAAYLPLAATDAVQALSLVLTERRKELLLRGLRWSDLRRLNQEAALAITLKKVVNGQTYTLPPNDPRYTLPLPLAVISDTGMAQN
ncbi:RagB/SusD family nutrient uptake outer membrane protein [Mucilaginibacter jinjuensis]|uniref:RagB/SusD family nutrient uptake outer membrane protein n=1 Tax=Mucilaginibacter jinjuensis TaxID=1176721 RepID=A0ABY7TFN8_9SPHI|nr:RagB/SusD family nutrient uptake outer membrane protein [Mucilaginibacter jinjuensis]WCT14427.1 RagB/SusD family nutrient uptake outer membrane protein [Mucilaginibacter jinjuensis]